MKSPQLTHSVVKNWKHLLQGEEQGKEAPLSTSRKLKLLALNTVLQIQTWAFGKSCRLCPPKLWCWKLIPSVMVFGGRAFGRWLGHERVELSRMRLVPLWKRPQRAPLPLLLCENTRRRRPHRNEKGDPPYQTPYLLVPLSWISQASELWEINFCS